MFKILDDHLKKSTFFVGKSISIADLTLASALFDAFRFVFEEKVRKNYTNLTKWFVEVTSHKSWVKVWGKVRLCVKEFPVF